MRPLKELGSRLHETALLLAEPDTGDNSPATRQLNGKPTAVQSAADTPPQ